MTYVAASSKRYSAIYEEVLSMAKNASDAEFYQKLAQLQQACDALEVLTPLLPDGSMDFPKVVVSSNIGESIALLIDGNNDTFAAYTLAKDLNYTFDFGPSFTFSATTFAVQGRLNFEDRIANSKFSGSNDGVHWTELTPQATGAATELTKLMVVSNLTNSTFRYLRIQKQGGGLFETSELRIYGQRHEAANH